MRGPAWKRCLSPAHTFDAMLSVAVLEHTPYPRQTLHEMARALKPGGRLMIIVPTMWEEHQMPHRCLPVFTRYGAQGSSRRSRIRCGSGAAPRWLLLVYGPEIHRCAGVFRAIPARAAVAVPRRSRSDSCCRCSARTWIGWIATSTTPSASSASVAAFASPALQRERESSRKIQPRIVPIPNPQSQDRTGLFRKPLHFQV